MNVNVAVILTTLVAVGSVAGFQFVQFRSKLPAAWRWPISLLLLGMLVVSLFAHPMVNRVAFQHTADQDLAKIEASLGGTQADLMAVAGEPDRIESLPMTVWTYQLGSRWLLWPRRSQVQVILAGGHVTQVTSIDRVVAPPGWRKLSDMTAEDAAVTEPETELELDAQAPEAEGASQRGDATETESSSTDSASESKSKRQSTKQAKVDPSADLPDDEFQRRLEAAILTSDRPPSDARLADAVESVPARVASGIEALNAVYEKSERSFRIEKIAGGYRFMTLPAYSQILAAVRRSNAQHKLSPSALETLAVVAYKQPVLRVDVETVRGVSCGDSLRALMERGLVKIVGRSDELGRPMLYGTTTRFLEVFGLASLKELPKPDEMKLES